MFFILQPQKNIAIAMQNAQIEPILFANFKKWN